MSQNNRNETRERRGEAPRPFHSQGRNYTPDRQEERNRNDSRINSIHMDRRSARENDLYERQSI